MARRRHIRRQGYDEVKQIITLATTEKEKSEKVNPKELRVSALARQIVTQLALAEASRED